VDDSDVIREFLIESNENLSLLDQQLVQLEANPADAQLLASIFRTLHTIKGTGGMLSFSAVEGLAHLAENLLSQLRTGERVLSRDLVSLILKTGDAIKSELDSIASTGKEKGTSHEPLQAELKLAIEDKNFGRGGAEANSAKSSPGDDAGQAQKSPTDDSTIRVDVGLLDRLMTLVGELVLARNRILQFSAAREDSGLNNSAQRLDLITTELQEGVMKTRMQPIGVVWNKLPRLVRDLAASSGKSIVIQMDGAETELDKTIIEAIKDPLTHLVRNCCDHGIEAPATRKTAGKPEQGTIRLRAYHEGGQVNIEISDDGAGISTKRLKHKAVQKGLLRSEQTDRMSERELLDLIFMPGFSTAEKVTNISGRGVGMDVVKTNIEKIGGLVDVTTHVGQGTTFKVRIPLTLAIIPALIVTTAGDRYAIPQVNLLELVRLEGEQARKGIELVNGAPVYRLRGRLLPLVYLKRELKATAQVTTKVAKTFEGLDFTQAREKHQQWIPRLRQVMDGKLILTREQAGSAKDCALGRWLYSSGMTHYGDLAETRALEETHRRFHECIHGIIAHKAAGCQGNGQRALDELSALSKDVLDLFSAVESKVREMQNANIVVLQADDRQFGLVVDEINDSEEIVVKPLGKQLKGISCYAGACIMGDGRVALILDVMGLAQQANVIDEARARGLGEKPSEVAGASNGASSFLLFAGPDDSRMAVPLATVARLEEVPVAQAETAGAQWVTQYRGQILPLINLEVALTERRRKKRLKPTQAANAPLQVVVCNHEGRLVGLLVERILDIVADTAELKYPPTRTGVLLSAVIQGKVTELLDIPALLRTSGVEFGGPHEPVVPFTEVTP